MTAEVVIFNKSAVALAADSAVSIEGLSSSKIYNNAEKLFALTKYHPVAIMIYERNELQGVPWELIIKAFRKKQGETFYNTLSEYKDAFLEFTREFYYSLPPKQIEYWCTQSIQEVVLSTLEAILDMTEEDSYEREMREIDVFDIAINELLDCYHDMPYFSELDENSLERAELEFDKFAYGALTEQIDTSNFTEKEDQDWLNTCNSFYVLCKTRLLKQDPFYVGLTGVVFAGYGEQEYFPEVCECEVYGAIDGQIKVVEKDHLSSNGATAGIKAFAQREEVNTFMEGVSVSTKNKFVEILKELNEFDESEIAGIIEKYVPEEERAKLAADIDERRVAHVNSLADSLKRHTQNHHVNKVVEMIAHLPKNELAYMAESLVNLTAFKRKVSYELDSVGGPIDVAIISKGDGLVWIKRKHYFPAELNAHYGPSK